jgi:hypothetical protein
MDIHPGSAHTRGDNNPDEVHQKVIQPKIIRLRSGIWSPVDILVKQAGRIIQHVAVQMAHAHNDLDWVAQRMPGCGQVCNNKAQWSPQELCGNQRWILLVLYIVVGLTTVIVSIHNTNVSEVIYRESDRAYSFHSCPKRSWAEAIWLWWTIKYPSKKQCKVPARYPHCQ